MRDLPTADFDRSIAAPSRRHAVMRGTASYTVVAAVSALLVLNPCHRKWSEGTNCRRRTTLMSLFQGVRHERSSPDRFGSRYEAEDRAWPGAVL